MHAKSRLILSFLVLALLCGRPVAAQIFDPCAPEHAAQGYPNCFSIGANVSRALDAESKLVVTKPALSASIERARQAYWAAYPKGPGLREKQTAYSRALATKDWYFKSIAVAMVVSGEGNDSEMLSGIDKTYGLSALDGGISPFARFAFFRWVNGLASSGNLFGSGADADYDYYVAMRNLAEFRKAGKRITNDPKEYMQLVLALGRGDQGPDFRIKGQKAYDERVALFGEAAVLKAARLVFDTPTSEFGYFEHRIQVNGFPAEDPFQAIGASLAGDNPRTMLLASFRGMNFDGQEDAQAVYDKMVAQFGEQAVLNAATKAAQGKRVNCGSGNKVVCVTFHEQDLPTPAIPHPLPQGYESSGTVYTATMLLLNPALHSEKDVMSTRLHVTVPNAVGEYGQVHLTKANSGKRPRDYGAVLIEDAKSVTLYLAEAGSYELWTEAPAMVGNFKSPVTKVEVPRVPTVMDIELKLDIPPGTVIHNRKITLYTPGERPGANSPGSAQSGFLPRGTRLLISTLDVIDLDGIDARRSYRAQLAAPVRAGSVLLPVGTAVTLRAYRMANPRPNAPNIMISIRAESILGVDGSHPIHTNGPTRILHTAPNQLRGGSEVLAHSLIAVSVE